MGNGMKRKAIWYFLLVVCINNVFILHHFFDTTTFTKYVTACRVPNLQKSFIWKTVAIKDHRHFPIHIYTQRMEM